MNAVSSACGTMCKFLLNKHTMQVIFVCVIFHASNLIFCAICAQSAFHLGTLQLSYGCFNKVDLWFFNSCLPVMRTLQTLAPLNKESRRCNHYQCCCGVKINCKELALNLLKKNGFNCEQFASPIPCACFLGFGGQKRGSFGEKSNQHVDWSVQSKHEINIIHLEYCQRKTQLVVEKQRILSFIM